MLDIQFSRDSQKFLQKLSQKKHLRQIKDALGRLRENPYPHDSQSLHGRYLSNKSFS
jgi:mRNA-degrading endonuclease RelE of RelBE toxin-antitoxin system